jgi:hypothetical protein
MLQYVGSVSLQAFLTNITAIDDCRKYALPNQEEYEHPETMELENINSDFVDASPVHTSTSPRESPLPGEISQVPPPNLIENADVVRNPTPSAFRPSLPPSRPSPPGMDLDSLTATGDPVPEVRVEKYSNATLTIPTAVAQRRQSKRKRQLDDAVSMGDEGSPKWASKRNRISVPDSAEEAFTKKSFSSAQSSLRKGGAPHQSGTTPASTPSSPSPPSWFSNFKEGFVEQHLGKEWEKLVQSWAAFEQREGYTEVRRLPKTGRPEIVGVWINRARPCKWRPPIDLKIFEREFKGWWTAIQPAWRIVDGQVDTSITQGDWASLRLPGLNGILSVVGALFFWGLAAQGKTAPHAAWLAAVKDCQLVISLL